ncbi:kinase-like domain-containing protein [Rhodocollybia butyracea]|uniref:Kinase-like domain-containing protein n=1 Tax=Rhodocollybia butyracea TaxID=206335 RepID=A0A9P5Q9P5_9AGAR|nr:kinase-like domain-containing protein [Rhodocollybia butyracea]
MTDVYELIIAGRQHEQLVGYDKDLDVIGAAQVYRIAPDAVAKLVRYPEQHEAFTMQYVAERTSIPIPRVRKVLLDRKDPSRHWIVMDFISGQTLVHCWRTLSIWRKLCIMCTLWWYIHQVKSLPLPNPGIPGPFDGTGLSLLCRGTQFPQVGAGPLKNHQELVVWFDYQLYSHQVRLHRGWGILWKSPKFPQLAGTGNPLVFCHNDLNMRNIMLDDNNRVWLLDWEYSGAYPPGSIT